MPTSAPAQGAPPQVRKGGRLDIGVNQAIATTAPYPGAQFVLSWALCNPLVSLDARSQPIPALAESWTFSDDRLTVTFKLRPGVVFHSGRRFTAEDAQWNIEYVKDPKNAAAAGGELKTVEVRPLDSATLQLKLPDVMPHLFSLLAGVLMVDPQSEIAQNAGGTGPFKLAGFSSGVEAQLVRNEQYWKPERPLLDAVTLRTLGDPVAAVNALEAGALGMAPCTAGDVQRLKQGAQTSAVVLPGSGNYNFLVSAVDPPFTDKRVRQAIDLSLNRKRFAETLLYGLTDPTHIIWVKHSPAWDASVDAGEFNLDRARQLLVEAGYPNGFETRIQASPAYPELVRFDEIVQADLAKIGVKASIEQLEANTATATIQQGRFSGLINQVYGYGDQDPAMQFTAFVLRPEGNASRFRSESYSQLIDSARRESNWDRRMALYRQIAVLVKDEAFIMPVANFISPWGMRANVRGAIRQPLAGYPVLDELWLA